LPSEGVGQDLDSFYSGACGIIDPDLFVWTWVWECDSRLYSTQTERLQLGNHTEGAVIHVRDLMRCGSCRIREASLLCDAEAEVWVVMMRCGNCSLALGELPLTHLQYV